MKKCRVQTKVIFTAIPKREGATKGVLHRSSETYREALEGHKKKYAVSSSSSELFQTAIEVKKNLSVLKFFFNRTRHEVRLEILENQDINGNEMEVLIFLLGTTSII